MIASSSSLSFPFTWNLGFDNYQDQYYDGQMALGRARSRRHSTVSFANWPTVGGLPGGYPGAINIKFKRKGSFVGSGIGLDEAQQRVKLSNNDTYSFHDMHADSRRRIYLKIKVIIPYLVISVTFAEPILLVDRLFVSYV